MVQLYRLTHTRAGWMHLDGICAASAHENPLRTHREVESVHGRRKEMQEGEGTFFMTSQRVHRGALMGLRGSVFRRSFVRRQPSVPRDNVLIC